MPEKELSLVAKFDELIRRARILDESSCEQEFLQYVRYTEENRVKWLECQQENQVLRKQLTEAKDKNYEMEIRYAHAREQIKRESQLRERSEIACAHKESQLALMREFLSDPNNDIDRERLNEISKASPCTPYHRRNSSYGARGESSASLLDDIDYDDTDDDIIAPGLLESSRKRHKRPSAPTEEEIMRDDKRQRKDDILGRDGLPFVCRTTFQFDADGQPAMASTKVYPARHRRSLSESALDPQIKDGHETAEVEMDEGSPYVTPNTNASNIRGILRNKTTDQLGTPVGLRRSFSAGNGLNKQHMFVSRKIVISETCSACSKKVKFGRILKCQGCNSTVHSECKDDLPLPCLPLPSSTPGKNKILMGKLSDFVPTYSSPMVPALVVHCVNEVEKRGLQEVGLYRVSGSEKQVKELKDKFYRGKGLPNMSQVSDIHVVCSVLKDFLLNLKEPLVTFKRWHEFANAAEHPNKQEGTSLITDVVNKLPQPNRDTLAFLVLHLQRVAESEECMMPVGNLSKIFGRSIVGDSTANPSPTNMMTEVAKQAMVMECLLSVPSNFWNRFVNIDAADLYPEYNNSLPRSFNRSRLGPISTPETYERTRAMTVCARPETSTPRVPCHGAVPRVLSTP